MVGEAITVGAACGALGTLAMVAGHRLCLTRAYFRSTAAIAPTGGKNEAADPPDSPADPAPPPPRVLVQLPVYNELNVVRRAVAALAALDWPRDRMEIQILDDSDDETTAAIAEEVARWGNAGAPMRHLRRGSRSGFKAGALAWGMEACARTPPATSTAASDNDLAAIFDADFIPPPDFLRRAWATMRGDPGLGLVQARWTHLNADENALTRAQALALDGHFVMESLARSRAGFFFNFNGTAGLWRRAAIEAAGGWTADTLTEDLDLSYRAQLAGWRFALDPTLEAPAELPAGLAALKAQQRRWAMGSTQTARKLLPRLWRAPIGARRKVEASFHLLCNFAYPALLVLGLALWPLTLLRERAGGGGLGEGLLWLETPTLALGLGSLAVFYGNARRELGESPLRAVARLPGLMALGAGLALNNSWAVAEGLLRRGGEFDRTPKRGLAPERRATTGAAIKRYAPGRRRALAALEIVLFAYLGWGLVWMAREGCWASLPFQALFCFGSGWIGARGWAD